MNHCGVPMNRRLVCTLLISGALIVPKGQAEARRERLPRDCRVVEKREIADQDGDGHKERVVRCRRPHSTSKGSCEELFVYYSRAGRRRVAGLCSSGGEVDTVGGKIELQRGHVIQRRWGGSSWAWEQRCDWDLKQRRVVETRETGTWRAQQSNGYEQRMDTRSGRREVRWWAPICAARGHDDPFGDPSARIYRGRYVPIPLQRTKATAPKVARCRDCRIRLPREGYISSRRGYGGAKDASLAIGARDDGKVLRLQVRLRDDRWHEKDRLLLLLGREPLGFDARCLPRRAALHRVAISAKSGALVGSALRGIRLRAQSKGRRGRAFEVALSGVWRKRALENGLSVAYRDHDRARERGTLISTSRLHDGGDGRDLGRFGPARARCALSRSLHGRKLARSCAELMVRAP